jgi:hypothetical protein
MDLTIAPFPPSSIARAEHLLDLRRKASSTTCERAYWQINLPKRDIFCPFGRADAATSDMIDIDECALKLKIETSNPSLGKCVFWEHCNFEGTYN